MKIFLKILSVFLLATLSTGAIYGSFNLVSQPDGSSLNMPVELLVHTPFNNYLIPGIILLIINGLFPVFVIVSIVLKLPNYKYYLIIQGGLLTGWLTVEIIFNKAFFLPAMHYPCYTTGAMLIAAGYILMKTDRRDMVKEHVLV